MAGPHARTVCGPGLGGIRGYGTNRSAGWRALSSPAPVLALLGTVTDELAQMTRNTGMARVRADPAELITGRAALAGYTQRGPLSAGGSSFLLRSADGWCATTLSRPDDLAAVPAILGVLGLNAADSAAEPVAALVAAALAA
jgi:hypothetical protein